MENISCIKWGNLLDECVGVCVCVCEFEHVCVSAVHIMMSRQSVSSNVFSVQSLQLQSDPAEPVTDQQ